MGYNIAFDKMIDLSHTVYTDCPSWVTLPMMHTEYLKFVARDGVTVSVISRMHMHTGTHVDAPSHFIENGIPVGSIDIHKFMGNGVVIDLSYKKNNEGITAEDLRKFDEQIREGEVVMLYTGWSKKRGYNSEYMYEWPYPDESGSQYLAMKKVKAVGIDAMSMGGWSDSIPGRKVVAATDSAVTHRILLNAGITIIEELNNLDIVLEGRNIRNAYFIFMPVKFRDTEASPVRAVALL